MWGGESGKWGGGRAEEQNGLPFLPLSLVPKNSL